MILFSWVWLLLFLFCHLLLQNELQYGQELISTMERKMYLLMQIYQLIHPDIKWLIKTVSTCLPSFVCACWKAIIWVVFVDELLPSVEEFSADDTGVSCGWVSTLKRRRLALPGEGELKRSAADTPAGGDISTSVITMLISHLHLHWQISFIF